MFYLCVHVLAYSKNLVEVTTKDTFSSNLVYQGFTLNNDPSKAVYSNPEDEVSTELTNICYHTDQANSSISLSTLPLDKFLSDSLEQCSEYCRYSNNCNFMAYQSQTSQCYFFQEPTRLPLNSTVYGSSSCLSDVEMSKKYPMRVLTDIYLGKRGPQLLIKDVHTLKCLKVEKGEASTYALSWGPCTNSSMWKVTPLSYREAWRVTVKHVQTQKCIKASAYPFGKVATLAKCTKNPSQILEVLNGMSESSVSRSIDYVTLELTKKYLLINFCEDCANALQNLTFETLKDHQEPCQKDIEIKNGRVVSKTGAPFFLPGTLIQVRCDPGYQVSGEEVNGSGVTPSNGVGVTPSNVTRDKYQFFCHNTIMVPHSCVKERNIGFGILFENRYLCFSISFLWLID